MTEEQRQRRQEYLRLYRKRNLKKIRAAQRLCYEKNREKYDTTRCQYLEENREKIRERQNQYDRKKENKDRSREWRQSDRGRESQRIRFKRYCKKHPDRQLARARLWTKNNLDKERAKGRRLYHKHREKRIANYRIVIIPKKIDKLFHSIISDYENSTGKTLCRRKRKEIHMWTTLIVYYRRLVRAMRYLEKQPDVLQSLREEFEQVQTSLFSCRT